jgi:glutathione peroxidase-family protein
MAIYDSDIQSLLGVPCNRFGGQEPGSADEIETELPG